MPVNWRKYANMPSNISNNTQAMVLHIPKCQSVPNPIDFRLCPQLSVRKEKFTHLIIDRKSLFKAAYKTQFPAEFA